MAETAGEPVDQAIKQKICVLKASIHCEGCKRKVKKILSHLQGVEFVDVDTKQQKVTVIGNVDADTLLKKLAKSGKKAELWPQKPEKIHGIGNSKEKEIETQKKMDRRETNPDSDNAKVPEASPKVQVATNVAEGICGPVKAVDGGSFQTGAGSGGGAAAEAVRVKTAADVEETEKEDNTREENCSAAAQPPQAAERKEAVEKSNGGGGGGESGTSGKRKKKKGQIGNSGAAAPPAHRELEDHEPCPPHQTNHSPPRNHHYPPPQSYYAPPPPPQPVYAVSYNTAYPTSSHTASYYAAPPPYSYAYMHPGPVAEPPPSDPDLNPRQPLDSFEIFSDENPNGCVVM